MAFSLCFSIFGITEIMYILSATYPESILQGIRFVGTTIYAPAAVYMQN